jgi:pumilio RNA-binding family
MARGVTYAACAGTAEQRAELVKQLEGRVLSLSLQMYGCRVIQKALEVLDSDGQRCLVDELDGHILTCVHDQNGNHVVQKAIEFCPPELRKRVTAAFTGASLRLAQHPYGCRVVQVRAARCTHPGWQR